MRIGIIGDLHFGASMFLGRANNSLNINSRLLDYADTLESTIDSLVTKGVEEIIFTGDIFEHRYPSLIQQKMFSQALHYAISKGIQKINIVVGNHDQQRANTTTTISYLKELNLPNIRIYDEFKTELIMSSGVPIANITFMPYRDRMWLGTETYNEAIIRMRDLLNEQISNIDNNLPKIVVGHMTIEGTLFDEEYRELYSENQLMLPSDMFNNINITIMGHIHKPEVVSLNPYIAYVGSMEKRGGFEDHDKVFAILDLEKAEVSYFKEPCREIYDLDLDYTSAIVGDKLQKRVFDDIVLFNANKTLEGSIIRCSLKICAEDVPYCDTKEIVAHLKDNYNVNHCTDIKKDVFSPRQSRDERITEGISDSEALRLFLENTVDDAGLRKDILDAGLDIMRSLEVTADATN
jgi:exonuclease SbcD